MELITKDTKGVIEWDTQNIAGKVVIIHPMSFRPQVRKPEYQLVVACGGFGCSPTAAGHVVFVQECIDDPEAVYYRAECRDILGIASDELIEEWKKSFGEFNQAAKNQIR